MEGGGACWSLTLRALLVTPQLKHYNFPVKEMLLKHEIPSSLSLFFFFFFFFFFNNAFPLSNQSIHVILKCIITHFKNCENFASFFRNLKSHVNF